MEILDMDGKIYTNEQKAIATIDFSSRKNLEDSDKSVVTGRDSIAKNGVFTFEQLKITIKPDSTANITVSISDLDAFGNDISFLRKPPVFVVEARRCVEGEQYTSNLECIECPSQFYRYDACEEECPCYDCLSEFMYCHGGNKTSPKPGFWRSNPIKNNFEPCFRPESCLGGKEELPLG